MQERLRLIDRTESSTRTCRSDQFTQVCGSQKTVSNEEDFELLYDLLDFKPMKRFECASDVRMLWSEGDDASW